MNHRHLLRGASACALAFSLAAATARAQEALPGIDIAGVQNGAEGQGPAPAAAPVRRAIPENIPAVVESVTRADIDRTVNVMTTAETMKYLPSVLVRERFIGDRNGILQTRVNTPIAGAQNLVYADNVLLSNLFGNTFSTAPRWGMVSPTEIDRIDLIYGPFSALYPGNSMGGVMTITTRMPENFEFHFSGNAGLQPYSLYGSKETNLAGDMNLLVGHKINDLSFWVSYDRLDAQGQSQTFPGGNVRTGKVSGTPIFGGYADIDQAGNPRFVGGANQADHSQQHMGKIKLDYELAPKIHAAYQLGFWSLIDDTTPTTYIRDANGVPIYNTQNGNVQVGNAVFPFTVNPSHGNASHLMQALSLKSDTKGVFDFDISGTSYNYLRDYNNTARAYGLLPNAAGTSYSINPRGSNVNLTGSFWHTLDIRGIWRPEWTDFGRHEVSVGAHWDIYSLAQTQTNTNVFTDNYYNSIQAINLGKTETKALYLQDVWWLAPKWKVTLGGRQEFWSAFGGVNNTLGQNYAPGIAGWPPMLVTPPTLPAVFKPTFSPKAAIEYQVFPDLTLRGSVGRYYRFPTVLELFQNISGPNSVSISNPTLQPESGTSYDLTGEYVTQDVFGGLIGEARPRISLFMDHRWNAILSQTDFTTGVSVSQNSNVGKAIFRGVEGAVVLKDIVWKGLDFNGSVTFTDAKIVSDYQQPWVQGMQYPRIPRIRIRAVASYAPTEEFSIAAGMRYGSAAFVSLNNSDYNHNNYGSVDSEYLVFDAKATYKISKEWTLNAGIDNIGRWKYYVNPNPYPQRTYFLGLKYDFGGPASGMFSDVKLGAK
ncbi:TonB-dependent receptor [Methylosinus sp. PW1]|uniref:TonB-dependent receptor n=1 Tax=Methylosinus sp. PW1 TaxID=107636 RepID=UPI0006907636|nr:TonB-dependent receptor [Methylosinus sp. PW1]